jgi:probable HAF family extracellular repeat protein
LSFWRSGAWEGIDIRDFGANGLIPHAINGDGTVVGGIDFPSGGGQKGFAVTNGKLAVLPTLGGVVGIAYGINDLGQIVGAATTPGDALLRPAKWSNGAVVDLGSLGGRLAAAHAINARGQVVGDSMTTGNVSRHAFFHEDGAMRDLDADPAGSSALWSINASGDAVGPSHEYRNGRFASFDALVNPYAFRSFYAVAINDAGLILANGCRSGTHCSALLLVSLRSPPGPPAGEVNVIEFHHAASNHFFITARQAEIDALDSGATPGWQRTGEYFRAHPGQVPGASAVCRFYIPPGFGDSHFFSASPAECAQTREKFPHLVPETGEAFFVGTPDATGGCTAGTTPVYRLWSQRAYSNHRYTTDAGVRDNMVRAGWLAEGNGPGLASFCAPG